MTEYTNKQVKQLVDKYYKTQTRIKQLIRDSYILTEQGTNEYYRVKAEHQSIKQKLDKIGVKP